MKEFLLEEARRIQVKGSLNKNSSGYSDLES